MRFRFACLLTVAASLCVPFHGTSLADVTMHQEIRNGGFGPNGAGASVGTTRTTISGQKGRTETTMEFTGKILGRMMGEKGGVTITRVDEGVIRELYTKKEAWSEVTFEQMRVRQEQAMQMFAQWQEEGQQPEKGDGSDLSSFTWAEPVVDVTRSGERETIAGQDCEQVKLAVTTTGTNEESGRSCDVVWTMDSWVTEGNEAIRDETMAFWSAYAEQLGFDVRRAQGMALQTLSMLEQYGEGWEQLFEEMEALGGMAMRTEVKLDMGGDCIGDAGQGETPTVEAPKNPFSAGKKMLTKFKFGKKKKKNDEPAEPEPTAASMTTEVPAGPMTMFHVTTEVTFVSTDPVPASTFDVPDGWKQIEARGYE